MKNPILEKIFIVFVVIFIFFSGFSYIMNELRLTSDNFPQTSTIQESKANNVFIKPLTPSQTEIYWDEKYDVVIREAWLEKIFVRKNRVLWISEIENLNAAYFFVRYALKDRITGHLHEDENFFPVYHMGKSRQISTVFTVIEFNKPIKSTFFNKDKTDTFEVTFH